MVWWPFGNKRESPQQLDLDPELQKYYDSVVEHKPVSSGVEDTTRAAHADIARIAPPSDGRRQKTIKQIAMDNCVEYEKAYSKCLVKGSYFERFAGCQTEMAMYEKCKDMQAQALVVLGYPQAASDQERKAIKMQADDLMIEAAPSLKITHEQTENFDKLLEPYK